MFVCYPMFSKICGRLAIAVNFLIFSVYFLLIANQSKAKVTTKPTTMVMENRLWLWSGFVVSRLVLGAKTDMLIAEKLIMDIIIDKFDSRKFSVDIIISIHELLDSVTIRRAAKELFLNFINYICLSFDTIQ